MMYSIHMHHNAAYSSVAYHEVLKCIQSTSSAQLWCIEVLSQVIDLSQVIIVQLLADGLFTKVFEPIQHVLVSSPQKILCNIVCDLC